ncbi:helix-turn-helix domain-containing protein [Paenibacillus macerans]|uniref:helix-turn-helix domain-containing protein n=1 Tax=Paenibacillus macerans TaxID=44252 RepID=UPI003D31515D
MLPAHMPNPGGWPYHLEYRGCSASVTPSGFHRLLITENHDSKELYYAAILLAPHQEWKPDGSINPDANCCLSFQLYQPGDPLPLQTKVEGLPYGRSIPLEPAAQAAEIIAQLRVRHEATSLAASLAQHIHLQKLLLLLLSASERKPSDVERAVHQTIDYIRQNFNQPISVAQLQKLSGMGRWQYQAMFRRLTGQRPLDFINELRMEKAKQLLSMTGGPLREIAKSVGLKDEYYLSRRFSQFMGIPPK